MATYSIKDESLTTICDGIREKTGKTDPIPFGNIPDGIQEVYDKGRNDEWSDFWDVLQDNGTRTNYTLAFKNGANNSDSWPLPYWEERNFKPKYDIIPIYARSCFEGAFRTPDVSALFANLDVEISFRNCTTVKLCFGNNWRTIRLPVLDLSSATDTSYFMCDTNTETVDKIISSRTTVWASTSFYNNDQLKNIVFEGEIANSLTFARAGGLTPESMKSAISCLVNYLGTDNEAKHTLTFTSACWEALEASTSPYEDGLTDDESFSWRDYINNLGWLTA